MLQRYEVHRLTSERGSQRTASSLLVRLVQAVERPKLLLMKRKGLIKRRRPADSNACFLMMARESGWCVSLDSQLLDHCIR